MSCHTKRDGGGGGGVGVQGEKCVTSNVIIV